MPVFTITGEEDPFLHVTLRHGEKIYCESNAMVMMESALELKGKMNGGLGAALMRTFANGESFFQQHIEAVKGDGDCLLAPTLPGAMQVLESVAAEGREWIERERERSARRWRDWKAGERRQLESGAEDGDDDRGDPFALGT